MTPIDALLEEMSFARAALLAGRIKDLFHMQNKLAQGLSALANSADPPDPVKLKKLIKLAKANMVLFLAAQSGIREATARLRGTTGKAAHFMTYGANGRSRSLPHPEARLQRRV